MFSFRDVPIKRKLTSLIVATSLSVLLAAGVALFSYEKTRFQDEIVNRISGVAEIVGANSAAALEFDDPANAEKTLETLAGREHIVAAAIYKNGVPFASYPSSKTFAGFPATAEEHGTHFGNEQLTLFQPIVFQGKRIGVVYIRAGLGELSVRLRSYSLILAAILFGSVVLAFAMSSLLQRFISTPILKLVDTVKAVTEGKDYSVHAAKMGRDELGQLIGGFNEMLTQIQARDAALRDSEAQFRAMFELAGVGKFQADPVSGRLLRVNVKLCEITGYTSDELLAMTSKALTHEDYHRRESAISVRLMSGEQSTYAIEKRFVCKDGSTIWVSVNATMLRDTAGHPQCVMAVIQDVTDRVRAEEEIRALNAGLERRVAERTAQLETANKELEAFSYSVSHDLRAPLRSIDGFSRIIEERYVPGLDATAKEYFKRVRTATQRMGQLIDDLLMLSRVTRSEMQHEQVNLTEMAASIMLTLQQREPNRKVEFVVPKDQPVMAEGDQHLLQIVLENLLGNAWKYSGKRESARIEFGTLGDPSAHIYYVRDNGAGFDMAFVKRLFTPFQRLHTAIEFPGSGIGLAIVHRIIQRHGGRTWAEASIEGGATIYFQLRSNGLEASGLSL